MIFGSKKNSNESEYKAIFLNLEEAVIIYDENFRIIDVNPAALRLLSLSKETLLDKVFGPDLANQKDLSLFIQLLFPSLSPSVVNFSEPGVYPQIANVNFPERNLFLRMLTLPIGNGSKIFAKIIYDISKSIETGLAKNEFINIAAHQFRTPLTAISWALETLKDEKEISVDGKDAVIQGLKEAKKLSKMITDLLDVSKIDEGKLEYNFQSADIVPFIDQIISNVKNFITEAGLKLKLQYEPEVKSVIATFDPNSLGLAISKIMDNAIKYNTENGEIKVKIRHANSSPYINLEIADTGVGVDKEELERISSKFYKADRTHVDGMGLGLYIAKSIVKRHGGTLNIDSVKGRGTDVLISLPVDSRLVPNQASS